MKKAVNSLGHYYIIVKYYVNTTTCYTSQLSVSLESNKADIVHDKYLSITDKNNIICIYVGVFDVCRCLQLFVRIQCNLNNIPFHSCRSKFLFFVAIKAVCIENGI